MTRKDYIAIAGAIKQEVNAINITPYSQKEYKEISLDVVSGIAHNICQVLHDDNQRFEHSRFLTACGIDS